MSVAATRNWRVWQASWMFLTIKKLMVTSQKNIPRVSNRSKRSTPYQKRIWAMKSSRNFNRKIRNNLNRRLNSMANWVRRGSRRVGKNKNSRFRWQKLMTTKTAFRLGEWTLNLFHRLLIERGIQTPICWAGMITCRRRPMNTRRRKRLLMRARGKWNDSGAIIPSWGAIKGDEGSIRYYTRFRKRPGFLKQEKAPR